MDRWGIPSGSRPSAAIQWIESGACRTREHWCLETINDGVQKAGGQRLSAEHAADAGAELKKQGYYLVPSSEARPGDFLVYERGHGHYHADGSGHIGIATLVNGEIKLFANTNGKVRGNWDAWLSDPHTKVYRFGGR